MKQSFWKTDWFTGVSLAVLLLFLSEFSFLQNADHLIYDAAIDLSSRTTNTQIAVIAIDDRSTEALGRWPWSRNVLARLIVALNNAQTSVIALTDSLADEQIDPGSIHLQRIQNHYTSSSLINILKSDLSLEGQQARIDLDQLDRLLTHSVKAVNADKNLTEAIDIAGNVLTRIEASTTKQKPLPGTTTRKPSRKSRLQIGNQASTLELANVDVLRASVHTIEKASLGAGHLLYNTDTDRKTRNHPLVIDYQDDYYPSLALQITANSLGFKTKDIRSISAQGIHIGNFFIPTDKKLQTHPHFYQGKSRDKAFTVSSAIDVLSNTLSSKRFKNKIVLIGTTGNNANIHYRTPLTKKGEGLPEVMMLAHTVSSLIHGHGISVPGWGIFLTALAWLCVLIYLIKFLHTLDKKKAWLTSSVLFISLIACEFLVLTQVNLWISFLWPAVLLLTGHIILMIRRPEEVMIATTEDTSRDISADNNYALGKTFLLQGQLDWAFDKLKKCHRSEPLMNKLSVLASSYEQNKQFVKAQHVYQLMSKHNADYPGLKERLKIASQRVGSSATLKPVNDQLPELSDQDFENRTMLGRYQIEKELGKGAMGKVYLGKDTRINRVVALKTLPLAAEFDESELDAVKARFFREAETAGQLNHPNIVTIYDAGEENGLAYIAMEFLTGHDLSRYTKADNLLAPQMVMGMIYKAAKALDYAHQHKVIHRDIKPANIMLDPTKKKIIITDFGIARITDTSRTRTGIVLGTPSYMSPEQLSGYKIDGRSDLFALGVMLFQLLTGELPFSGDSLSMLMFVIANEPHRNIAEIRPELTETYPELANLLDLALAKDPIDRFQSGNQMANTLKQCAQK